MNTLKNMQYESDIIHYLNHIKSEVELYNGLKLYNINKFAEYFYSEFLNLLFGYELEIMEKVNPNMVAIDLGDKNGKIAIQITSQVERKKIKETVEKFNENGLDKIYERLVVLHIANETPNYNKPHTIEQFNLKEDVWNIEYLLSKMPIESIDKLEKIRDLLKKYVEDSPQISNLDTLLKQRYTSENFTKLKPLSSPNQDIHLQDIYQDLSIIKKKKNDEEKDKEINIDELLNESKKVSILGKSGIGKSTLTKYICYQWADGKLFNNYDYLFYIPIKKWEKGEGIFDVVVKVLKESINENIKIKPNDLYEYIKSSNNETLFVIDGFDEIKDEYREEIKKEIQNFDSYIITSRHNGLNKNELNIEETFENEGFNQESIENFIRHISNSDELIKQINNNSQLKELSKIPMLLDMICYLYKRKQLDFNSDFTMTALYEKFLLYMIRRFQKKRSKEYHSISKEINEVFIELGNIAFEKLKTKEFQFKGEKFINFSNYKLIEKELLPFGLLTSITNEEYIEEREYSFIHTSFQEYFSALYVASLSKKKKRGKIIRKWKFYPHMQVFFAFLGGLIEDKEFLLKEIESEPKDLMGFTEFSLLFNCVSEMKKLPKNRKEDLSKLFFYWLDFFIKNNLDYNLILDKAKLFSNFIDDEFINKLINFIKDKNINLRLKEKIIVILVYITKEKNQKIIDIFFNLIKSGNLPKYFHKDDEDYQELYDYESMIVALVYFAKNNEKVFNKLVDCINDNSIDQGIRTAIAKSITFLYRYEDIDIEQMIEEEYFDESDRLEWLKDEALIAKEVINKIDKKFIKNIVLFIENKDIDFDFRSRVTIYFSFLAKNNDEIIHALTNFIKNEKDIYVTGEIAQILAFLGINENIIIDTLVDRIKNLGFGEHSNDVLYDTTEALLGLSLNKQELIKKFINLQNNNNNINNNNNNDYLWNKSKIDYVLESLEKENVADEYDIEEKSESNIYENSDNELISINNKKEKEFVSLDDIVYFLTNEKTKYFKIFSFIKFLHKDYKILEKINIKKHFPDAIKNKDIPSKIFFNAFDDSFISLDVLIEHIQHKLLPIYINENNKLCIVENHEEICTKKDVDVKLFPKGEKNLKIKSSKKNKELHKQPLIITEGKTDWKHLKKALERFKARGEYPNLDIEFDEYEDIGSGESNLDTRLKSLAKQHSQLERVYIGIFDRDTDSYVKEYGKKEFIQIMDKDYKNRLKEKIEKHYGDKSSPKYKNIETKLDDGLYQEINSDIENILTGDEYKDWIKLINNKVYAFCIPEIKNSNSPRILDKICIEFYYKEEDLKIKHSDEKRLFFADEFELNLNNDGDNSKNDFTKYIENDVEGFDNFDIENFRLIFDVIKKIVK